MNDRDKNKGQGARQGRDEGRQIKEGAIRPVDNPKQPPPTTIEVEPSGGNEPAGSSPEGSDE